MKFMLMIIDNEPFQARLSKEATNAMIEQVRAVENAIAAEGKMIDSRALRPSNEAVTVRMRDGEITVTDGPFAESREVLGGYFIVDCGSREEAIDWARKFPLSEAFCTHVRQIDLGGNRRWARVAKVLGPAACDKFLLTLYPDRESQARLSDRDRKSIPLKHVLLSMKLLQHGHFIISARLSGSDPGTTVKACDDTIAALDGPFAETKEQAGGFFLIQCRSKDEAIAWAKKFPDIEWGAIEVRPVWEMS